MSINTDDLDIVNVKECSICKQTKKLQEFHNLKHGKCGKHSNCKECRKQYRKQLKYEKPKDGKMKCMKCNTFKEVSEYYRDRSSSTGLQTYCKSCLKESIYESQSKLEGFISKLLTGLTKQLEKKKLLKDLQITKQDILDIYQEQKKECALCRELLTYYTGPVLTSDRYESRFNITIAKKDNLKPYIKDNIYLLGQDIYSMKGNLSDMEFKRLCALITDKDRNIDRDRNIDNEPVKNI